MTLEAAARNLLRHAHTSVLMDGIALVRPRDLSDLSAALDSIPAVPADCTGYVNDSGNIAHDGDTCPIHEDDPLAAWLADRERLQREIDALADLFALAPVFDRSADQDEYEATHVLANENGTYILSNPRVEIVGADDWIVAPYRCGDSGWFAQGSFPLSDTTNIVRL